MLLLTNADWRIDAEFVPRWLGRKRNNSRLLKPEGPAVARYWNARRICDAGTGNHQIMLQWYDVG